MGTQIGLVAVPRRRRGGIWRAREQYDPSIVFRRARDYCDRAYDEWYILSTAHGLIPPHQVIGSDAPALCAMPASARNAWAEQVAAQMCARIERSAEPPTFVLYTSQECAELLQRAAPFAAFELPLSGMMLGGRLHWYAERLQIRSRVLQPLPSR
jgi:hypothetical protein